MNDLRGLTSALAALLGSEVALSLNDDQRELGRVLERVRELRAMSRLTEWQVPLALQGVDCTREEFDMETATTAFQGATSRWSQHSELGTTFKFVSEIVAVPAELRALLDKPGPHRLYVDSVGGCLFAGLDVLTACAFKVSEVEIRRAYSAAAVCACSMPCRRSMHKDGRLMLHSPWSVIAGTPEMLRREADSLERMRELVAEVLQLRTGRPKDEVLAWMTDWRCSFTAEQALERNLIDSILS